MIAHLRGRLVSRSRVPDGDDTRVVVDVDGIGYVVLVPANLTGRLPTAGDEIELHTSLQVREDSMTLYGFPTAGSRDLFEVLMGASGVGPKLALAALSTHSPETLRTAIVAEDLETLRLIPGIGVKSAKRVVLALQDRVGDLPTAATGNGQPTGTAARAPSSALGEVRVALSELGYDAAEVRAVTAELDPDMDVEDLLRSALRSLDGSGASPEPR